MDNSLYISLSRQLALARELEVTTNNVANLNTVGFQAHKTVFDSYLAKDVNQRVVNPMGFANGVATYRDTRVGPMQQTGNEMDLAINGQGYFGVETPLGVRYTRAGNFRIAGDGTLTTADGNPVLDPSNQRITFPDDVRKVEFGSIGNIRVNGEDFGQLGVHQFDNEQLLESVGNNLFRADATPRAAENVIVAQGVLESSNVQSVSELNRLISINRSFAQITKHVSSLYELQRRVSNAWAEQQR